MVDVEIFVPDVERDGIELELERNHLIVTAHRDRPVLHNWQAANLGAARHDYRLHIHLPGTVDPKHIWGELRQGVFRLHLRKATPETPARVRIA